MQKQLKVTYHYNSGFSIRIGGKLLVFDYWEGEGRKLAEVGRLNKQILSAYEQVYVFVSHAHPDHFSPMIYEWREDLPVTYIVSSDMPIGTRGKRIAPLETLDLAQDISVKAFDSTDLGVSLLVRAYGINIFHAGDLNLWHWRQESSLREIEAAENAFYAACAPMKGERIDLAMFPVDPRQGMLYDAGANHFILTQKPRVFIPMHWQDRTEVAIDFARRAKTPHTEVLALTRPGESATITYQEKLLDIHIIEPPRDMADLPIAPLRRPEKTRMEAQGEDPFADSDLPVDLE
ncbi:MAG: MBL fold metallo-hydrolase [Clostridiales bacterium]|nr:MBL fold metallo-hydrolase [Clostridiales bacterium]